MFTRTAAHSLRRVALAAALLAYSAAGASAEEPRPDMETKTFGSWTMRCMPQNKPPVPPCDIVQSVTNRDTGQQVMQASFAFLPDKGQYGTQFLLPLGFLIQSGVLIRIDGAPDITDWPVTRCEPQGCLVEKLVPAETLKPFREKDKGTLAVLGADGKPVGFPIDLKGFAPAMDAMTARNKAAVPAK
ncbi:invasion associated locus B family protein [Zavarzinia sp.]|uniref:invasion associated locus B family protein n=1 Tax=Zavarzinia sp. TaxID=2027920 RepID=UPI0035692D7B